MRQTRIAKKQQQEQSRLMERILEESNNSNKLLPSLRHHVSSKIGPNGRLLSPNHANFNKKLRVDEQLAQHPLIEPSLRLSKRKIQLESDSFPYHFQGHCGKIWVTCVF